MSPLALFVVRLAAVGVPLAVLAWWKRVYPNALLAALVGLPALFSLGLFASSGWFWTLAVLDLAVALAAAADLATLPRKRQFSLVRESGRVASLGKPHRVDLTLINHARRGWQVRLRDGCPAELAPRPEEFAFEAVAASRTTLEYRLTAGRRGAFELGPAFVRAGSRLGLWQRHLIWRLATPIHVYPDMQQLRQYALLARTDRLSLLGVRSSRRVGQDNEFERLRDYTPDDNFKHIEWKSTARRGKLTVKDFQRNQSQRIVFLIDCGRLMANRAPGGMVLLDHALNAMLMLSYVALSHGDAAGLLCFGDEIQCYVPPRGGLRQMNRLEHASFDRFARLVESRYDQAFLYLSERCRKRSLVILITALIDDVNARQLTDYLGNLSRKHLPLLVTLGDRAIEAMADAHEPRGSALYRAAAAADLLTWRAQALSAMHARGALVLDAFPDQLTAALVNRYLAIKARKLL